MRRTARNGCLTVPKVRGFCAEYILGFLGAAAGSQRRGVALTTARLFEIELGVGVGEKFFDALAVAIVDRDTNAGGELRVLGVAGHDRTDTVGDALGFVVQSFRQDESEFVAAIARGGVNGAAVDAQDVRESTERVAADEMAVGVVDFLEAVEVQEENSEGGGVGIGALGFGCEDVEQAAVVGEPRKRVADGEMAYLLEEAGIVEESTAESHCVAGDGERLREDE